MLDDAAIRSLLSRIEAPHIDLDLVKARVLQVYGLAGEWKRLTGEREQNLRLDTASGNSVVVKIASASDNAEGLHFEAEALAHIERVDPALPVPKVVRTSAGELQSTIGDRHGLDHPLRLLTFVPGRTLIEHMGESSPVLSMEDLFTLGEFHGRLARSLQGFHHPAARRPMAWDLSNGLVLGSWLDAHLPQSLRSDIGPLLGRFAATLPQLARLRSQVIYNDFHESNVLVRDTPSLEVCGIIDFGDMRYGPVVQDLAVAVASLIHWSPDPVPAAAALIRGYQRHMPLEASELSVLLDLTLARLILHIGLVSYQKAVNGREDANLDQLQSLYVAAVKRLSTLTADEFVASVPAAVVPSLAPLAAQQSDGMVNHSLMTRRQAVLGKAYTFYDEPLELVRGRGTRLYDSAGHEYLDCYNNVANVGHAHPYVVEALARQAATLNTNSRYLHTEILRLGERLSATLPEGLDTWFFVCTGSEANDLAVRIARAVTGRHGVVVTEHSYHGNTSLLTPLSLLEYDIKDKPDWVGAVPPPNIYRGPYRSGQPDLGARYAAHVSEVAEQLTANGQGMAALLLDSIFDGNGALVPPQDYLPLAFEHARRAGALVIADEVQMGFGRSGTDMWGFQAFGVQPDIVTMGKPMGNGHPIAALVTRRDIALAFQNRTGYFNTFGGNTVSSVVANATLDVLQGDGLQERALRVGAHLKALLDGLMQRHELVGHVHGRGLFYGVELVGDRSTRKPAKLAGRWVRERMKSLGVLVASSGPLGNIIKIRPPLSFDIGDADLCFDVLNRALSEIPPDRRN
jgi:4-aminobutyrate aminotransferase-like enzyme/Ser/Thr protein kinase RdoA (MazF antagonist)